MSHLYSSIIYWLYLYSPIFYRFNIYIFLLLITIVLLSREIRNSKSAHRN